MKEQFKKKGRILAAYLQNISQNHRSPCLKKITNFLNHQIFVPVVPYKTHQNPLFEEKWLVL